MITKSEFVNFCQLYRKQSEKLDALYKLKIDLINFADDYWAAQSILMEGLFTKLYSDLIIDWLTKNWDGKIYEHNKGPKLSSQEGKLIEHIKSDEELYDYIISCLKNE